jgi:hypothetical protein
MTRHRPRTTLEWALITLILLVAALLRFHDLGNIPKGLEHDEVATWHMVRSVLDGHYPLYFEEGYGHEPLYNYLTAFPMAILGDNWLGERFWAPWLGMFAVATTYALMRRMFNPLVGLSAAGFQATVLWALFFNRLGLRLNLLPFLLCTAAYCFWRGTELSRDTDQRPTIRLAWFAAAGALVGLCLYTYMSSRVAPLIFAAFSVYLIVHDLWIARSGAGTGYSWRQVVSRWWPVLSCFVVAGLVVLPLALYLLDRPDTLATPQRESQVDVPLRELRRGNLGPVLENAWGLLKMWNVDGERYWQLNYAHRPVFVDPLGGLLFWLGALVVLWRWKEPRMALLIFWIGLAMVPSLLTSEAPSWPRTMLASPAALTLPGIAVAAAIGLCTQEQESSSLALGTSDAPGGVTLRLRGLCASVVRWLGASDKLVRTGLVATLVIAVGLGAFLTYRDFLLVWPENPRVRYAFQSSMTEALRYLDAAPDVTPVVIAGLSPHDMDPWTERSTLQRPDLPLRWVDARSALVLPPGDSARLIVLDITPTDPALSSWAELDRALVVAQGEVAARGGAEHDADAPVYYDPAYTVYGLDVGRLRERLQDAGSRVYVGADAHSPAPLPAAPGSAPVDFGGLVRLLGYEWLTPPQPGQTAHLLTFWQALDTGPSSTHYGEPALRTFLHLLSGDQVAAGEDVLGAAPDTWLPGDVIVQLHSFTSPASPGTYAAELGWYIPPDGPRLSVDGIDAPGDRILLEPVEVHE